VNRKIQGLLYPVRKFPRFFSPGPGTSVHPQGQTNDDFFDFVFRDNVFEIVRVLFFGFSPITYQRLRRDPQPVTYGQTDLSISVIYSQYSQGLK
jgi:hypothetical protein